MTQLGNKAFGDGSRDWCTSSSRDGRAEVQRCRQFSFHREADIEEVVCSADVLCLKGRYADVEVDSPCTMNDLCELLLKCAKNSGRQAEIRFAEVGR